MPELPDVEAFRRTFVRCAQRRVVQHIEVHDAGVLHGLSGRQLRHALEGRRFAEPERHGKWLIARTGGPILLLHFGMTGRLVCTTPEEAAHPHDRVVFTMSRHHRLRYRDQRKLQGLWLVDEAGLDRVLGRLGPDAATVPRDAFRAALAARRGRLKAVLMDQSVLAGLGNLLVDEILWRTLLPPSRPVRDLTDEEGDRLHAELRRTLRAAVRAGCVPPRDTWLTGRRDDPDPHCPRCGGPLRRGRVAGRGTVWCPRCQP
ncbi:Fpg/Nei family DNA glycosylase [Streptomyces lydicus]|uniref:Fpg/Nei family DNA glycosylase n=1 Tax=Streptomyces lydicus TaxID=47763 RepID=UPI00368EF656